ncbi:MAG: septum formation initiator family protein [Tissierellia bacterium]|nr:septum formation initiator family protein [Tissierellia bacterium]
MSSLKKFHLQRKRKNRKFVKFLLGISIIVFSLFFALSVMQKNKINELDRQISAKEEEIDKLNLDIDSLKKDYKSRNTDKFKEKIARERLKMLKDDEYLYEDKNK